MEKDLIKSISGWTPIPEKDMEYGYRVLESYDLLLLAAKLHCSLNQGFTSIINTMAETI